LCLSLAPRARPGPGEGWNEKSPDFPARPDPGPDHQARPDPGPDHQARPDPGPDHQARPDPGPDHLGRPRSGPAVPPPEPPMEGRLLVPAGGGPGLAALDPAARGGGLPLALHPVMTFTGRGDD